MFNEEVQIITFIGNDNANARDKFNAAVLPRSYFLKSLGQPGVDINDKILMHGSSITGCQVAINQLLKKTEHRIGEILKVDDGQFRIDTSTLPGGYFDVPVVEPTEPPAVSPGPKDTRGEDASKSQQESADEERKKKEEKAEADAVADAVAEAVADAAYAAAYAKAERELERKHAAWERWIAEPTKPAPQPAPTKKDTAKESQASRPEGQQDTLGSSSSTVPLTGAGPKPMQRILADRMRFGGLHQGFGSKGDEDGYDIGAFYTPSVSDASETTTTPGLDAEDWDGAETATEMNRSMVRDEVNHALGKIFGGLAEQARAATPLGAFD